MAKHTIELNDEEMRIIKVVKAVKDITSIDKAITFIVKDYANSNSYSRFIEDKRDKK